LSPKAIDVRLSVERASDDESTELAEASLHLDPSWKGADAENKKGNQQTIACDHGDVSPDVSGDESMDSTPNHSNDPVRYSHSVILPGICAALEG